MKPLPFLISKSAVIDLEEIWLFTASNWSVSEANRYYQLIIDEINHICSHPETGRTVDTIRKGYRVTKVKSHLIFYRASAERIEIIRILHEQMDIDSRLTE